MKKIIYLITILTFLFFVIFPLLTIVVGSFFKNGMFNLECYLDILNINTLFVLLKSAGIAFAVAAVSTSVGGFFAYTLTKTNLPLNNFFKLVFLIPLFISPYIIAVSWVDFFILSGYGKSFIYSQWGVVFVLSLIFSPLAMLIISSALVNLSASLEEAGLMMTTYAKTILKVVFPLIRPALISSFILIFVLAISQFSVPFFLSVNLFTTEIFTQFSAFYNYDLAVANSMVLVFVCICLLLTERFYLADASFISVSSKSGNFKIIEFKKSKLSFLIIHFLYATATVIIPISVLFVQSFKGENGTFAKAVSLLWPNIFNSLFYALAGAFILVFFGLVFALMKERKKIKSINVILLITFGIPSTVLGIGLIKSFNTPFFDFIYSGFPIIIIGYLGRFIFISEKLISNAIKQIPYSFSESAELAGAGFFLRTWKIMLPLISSGLFAAFAIGFIFCLGELGMTILIYPPGTSPLPVNVFTIMANAPQSLVSAMSLVVLIITFAALAVFFAGYKILLKRNWSYN